jgi:hypothetical protein
MPTIMTLREHNLAFPIRVVDDGASVRSIEMVEIMMH